VRPSTPNYLPWSLRFFGLLAALVVLALIALELDLVTFAYERLGLGHRAALGLLLGSLFGSAINIPVARYPEAVVASGRIVSVFGVPYVVPVVESWPGTIVAVNLGGAVFPTLLSAYLLYAVGHVLPILAVVAVVAAVTHRFARLEPGVGIVIPILVPALASALAAWLIAPEVRAAAAYVGGTLGTLIGADLLNLGRMRGSSAPVASIGGAGTFDGIFVAGIVSVLIA
jgi:uncharacterized membrane protein